MKKILKGLGVVLCIVLPIIVLFGLVLFPLQQAPPDGLTVTGKVWRSEIVIEFYSADSWRYSYSLVNLGNEKSPPLFVEMIPLAEGYREQGRFMVFVLELRDEVGTSYTCGVDEITYNAVEVNSPVLIYLPQCESITIPNGSES